MNFKERLQKLNKKNIAITVAILFLVSIISVCGYEYYQMKHFENTTMAPNENEPDLTAPEQEPQQEPTKKPSEYNIGITYDKAIKGNKPIMVLFLQTGVIIASDLCQHMKNYQRFIKKIWHFQKLTWKIQNMQTL